MCLVVVDVKYKKEKCWLMMNQIAKKHKRIGHPVFTNVTTHRVGIGISQAHYNFSFTQNTLKCVRVSNQSSLDTSYKV